MKKHLHHEYASMWLSISQDQNVADSPAEPNDCAESPMKRQRLNPGQDFSRDRRHNPLGGPANQPAAFLPFG